MEHSFSRFGVRARVMGAWIVLGDRDFRYVERNDLMSSDYDVVVDEYETVKSYNRYDELLHTKENWVGSHTETRSDFWTKTSYESVAYTQRILEFDDGETSLPFDDEGLESGDRVYLVQVEPRFAFGRLRSWYLIPGNLVPRRKTPGIVRNLLSRAVAAEARRLAQEDRISLLSRITRGQPVHSAYTFEHSGISFAPLWIEGGVAKDGDGEVVKLPGHDGRDGFAYSAWSEGRIVAWHAATDAAWVRRYPSRFTPWAVASLASWIAAAALVRTGHPLSCSWWLIPAPFLAKAARDQISETAEPQWKGAVVLAALAAASVWKAYHPVNSTHMLCAFGMMAAGYLLWTKEQGFLMLQQIRSNRARAGLRAARRATTTTARNADPANAVANDG